MANVFLSLFVPSTVVGLIVPFWGLEARLDYYCPGWMPVTLAGLIMSQLGVRHIAKTLNFF